MTIYACAWYNYALNQFQSSHMTLVDEKITKLLSAFRPIAVSLVDSYDIPDEILQSTLGAFDGNVYERMLDQAKKGALNEDDVQPSFEKYLKPLMKSNL